MKKITKLVFLNAIACPTLGWLLRNLDEADLPEVDLAEQFRMEQGIEIGKRARKLYPDGILVRERDTNQAISKTLELLADKNVNVIFEGAIGFGNYIARADILKRYRDGWHLIEVKSNVNDDAELVDDLAYTTMVCLKAGINITKASLLLISKDYRLGMDDTNLFVEIDHTFEASVKAEEFFMQIDEIDETTGAVEKPAPEIMLECKKCEFFRDCVGKGVDNHIFEIPRLSAKKFEQLKEMDIFSIADIPDNFPLTSIQKRMYKSVKSKQPIIENNFWDLVNSVKWPAYYLDFETVMTVIPLYPDIAPYTQIPTQYSIHKCSDFGKVEKHFEYLADPSRDCRRELALNLIKDLEGNGSIICYSNFEKTVINGLIKLFPDLSNKLSALIDRIVDLEKIIREGMYHPEFHGKTSIKMTLPALVPDMTYQGLEIANGDNAMAAFAYMAMGRFSGNEADKIKKALLEYCKQDTLAMVRLHEKLMLLAKQTAS